MREVVGSFTRLADVRSVIGEERRIHLRRRQVVSILLIKPNGKAVCLCVAEGAIRDNCPNLSPPQGGIELGESLYGATVRELDEELGVAITGSIVYLGSMIRVLTPDHRHYAKFHDCHHHWVAVFASSDKLRPRDSQAEADWHYHDTLSSMSQTSMSRDKAIMFNAARKELVSISGDPYLIRREQLGKNLDKVA